MANKIDWTNLQQLQSPNASLIGNAGDLFSKAITGLQKVGNDIGGISTANINSRRDKNTGDTLTDLANAPDRESVAAILNNSKGSLVDSGTVGLKAADLNKGFDATSNDITAAALLNENKVLAADEAAAQALNLADRRSTNMKDRQAAYIRLNAAATDTNAIAAEDRLTARTKQEQNDAASAFAKAEYSKRYSQLGEQARRLAWGTAVDTALEDPIMNSLMNEDNWGSGISGQAFRQNMGNYQTNGITVNGVNLPVSPDMYFTAVRGSTDPDTWNDPATDATALDERLRKIAVQQELDNAKALVRMYGSVPAKDLTPDMKAAIAKVKSLTVLNDKVQKEVPAIKGNTPFDPVAPAHGMNRVPYTSNTRLPPANVTPLDSLMNAAGTQRPR